MAMKDNQMAIIKACSFKLDADTTAIVAEMYHTEKDPATNKVNRKKSEYWYCGRILKNTDLQAEIAAMNANPTANWKWPNLDQKWNILYCWEDINERGAKWLKDKMSKAVDIELGMKLLAGAKKNRIGEYEIKDSAKYETLGYTADDGSTIDLTAESIKKLGAGHWFMKKVEPKRKA